MLLRMCSNLKCAGKYIVVLCRLHKEAGCNDTDKTPGYFNTAINLKEDQHCAFNDQSIADLGAWRNNVGSILC